MSSSQQDQTPTWLDEESLRVIDRKLEHMTHQVGESLTVEEMGVLREALRNVSREGVGVFVDLSDRSGTMVSIIENALEEGMCYLKLLITLPSFRFASPELLSELIIKLKSVLGKDPPGKMVVLNLTLSNSILSGRFPVSCLETGPLLHMNAKEHLETLASMITSKSRFTYQEVGGRFHVDRYRVTCECKDILCDHGWASKFILQVITRDGCLVGADPGIDFSAMFVEVSSQVSDSEGEGVPAEGLIVPPKEKKPVRAKHEKDLQAEMATMLGIALDSRTKAIEDALKQLLSEKCEDLKSQSKSGSRQSYIEDVSEDEDTVMPLDSSSQCGRYGRKFMRDGTVYSVGLSKTRLEAVPESGSLQIVKNVVGGFQKTRRMEEEERESVSQVHEINGLAQPFKNPRLNFLLHFHTAVSECQISVKAEPSEAFDHMGTLKPRNPTEELMKQVIVRTFDFENMAVVANPFQLPFIELGMLLSDSCLVKCLSMLGLEYKSLWFQEFKCLKVPRFHDEFKHLSTSPIKSGQDRGSTRAIREKGLSQRRVDEMREQLASSADFLAHEGKRIRSKKASSVLGFKF